MIKYIARKYFLLLFGAVSMSFSACSASEKSLPWIHSYGEENVDQQGHSLDLTLCPLKLLFRGLIFYFGTSANRLVIHHASLLATPLSVLNQRTHFLVHNPLILLYSEKANWISYLFNSRQFLKRFFAII